MKEAEESFRILISLVRKSITKFEKVSYQSNSKRSRTANEPSALRTKVIKQHQVCHQQEVTQVLWKCASNVKIVLELVP